MIKGRTKHFETILDYCFLPLLLCYKLMLFFEVWHRCTNPASTNVWSSSALYNITASDTIAPWCASAAYRDTVAQICTRLLSFLH